MSFICLDCIMSKPLCDVIKDSEYLTTDKCKYCKETNLGVYLKDLAEIVDEYLQDYCQIGDEIPRFNTDSDEVYYEREGENLCYLLQEELEIEEEPAIELADILEENDKVDIRHGEEPFYSSDNNYCRKYISDYEYLDCWESFCLTIKHMSRFFDEKIKDQLEEILGKPGSDKANRLPTLELGLGTDHRMIYRARLANSKSEVKRILENPKKELGPPPLNKTRANRMNPIGVRVFYGAISKKASIAEVRPFAGSLVVVGQFEIIRKLKLLDLSNMGYGFTGSIFHPEYEDRAGHLQFLQRFHSLIAKPIQKDDEPLEYIPTQAIAEYIFNVLGLDGILYGSAQLGGVPDENSGYEEVYMNNSGEKELETFNVVLFGGAAIVKLDNSEDDDSKIITYSSSPTLNLVADSVEVVKVEKVNYEYNKYNISFIDDLR